eukprot:gene7251-5461_t
MTEAGLKKMLGVYGSVKHVTINPVRRYAFVVFDDSTAATAAVDALGLGVVGSVSGDGGDLANVLDAAASRKVVVVTECKCIGSCATGVGSSNAMLDVALTVAADGAASVAILTAELKATTIFWVTAVTESQDTRRRAVYATHIPTGRKLMLVLRCSTPPDGISSALQVRDDGVVEELMAADDALMALLHAVRQWCSFILKEGKARLTLHGMTVLAVEWVQKQRQRSEVSVGSGGGAGSLSPPSKRRRLEEVVDASSTATPATLANGLLHEGSKTKNAAAVSLSGFLQYVANSDGTVPGCKNNVFWASKLRGCADAAARKLNAGHDLMSILTTWTQQNTFKRAAAAAAAKKKTECAKWVLRFEDASVSLDQVQAVLTDMGVPKLKVRPEAQGGEAAASAAAAAVPNAPVTTKVAGARSKEGDGGKCEGRIVAAKILECDVVEISWVGQRRKRREAARLATARAAGVADLPESSALLPSAGGSVPVTPPAQPAAAGTEKARLFTLLLRAQEVGGSETVKVEIVEISEESVASLFLALFKQRLNKAAKVSGAGSVSGKSTGK